jgi:uncharacterized protein YodC (DUF2158 family)
MSQQNQSPQVGSVVELKSGGGPKMTVQKMVEPNSAECVYFNDSNVLKTTTLFVPLLRVLDDGADPQPPGPQTDEAAQVARAAGGRAAGEGDADADKAAKADAAKAKAEDDEDDKDGTKAKARAAHGHAKGHH